MSSSFHSAPPRGPSLSQQGTVHSRPDSVDHPQSAVVSVKDEPRRSFTRSTSHAWEKLTNVIRKPSMRVSEKEKTKLKELEPRVTSMESGMQRIGEELEAMRMQHKLHKTPVTPSSSTSSSTLSASETVGSHEENTKEELAATMIELKELNDRHSRLQHTLDKERRGREEAEREVTEMRRRLAEGSIPFIDSDASPRFPSVEGGRRNEKEDRELTRAKERISELEGELERKQKEFEKTILEQGAMIRDMLTAVKVAQTFKDEAEAEVRRCREAHKALEGDEDSEVWSELKRGREPTSRRNALLEWVRECLSTHGFPLLSITNFSTSWADGRALCALVSIARPEIVSREAVESSSDLPSLALKACNGIGIKSMSESLLSTGAPPDWRQMMHVVLDVYKALYYGSSL